MTPRYNTAAIRAAFPLLSFFAAQGVVLRRSGSSWVGRCVLHQEQIGESFVVDPNANTWSCFGRCQLKRKDVIDFVQAARGMSFIEACELLGGSGLVRTPLVCRKRELRRPDALPELTRDQLAIMTKARLRLYEDERLCARIAERRGWKPATIRALSIEFGLGWIDSIQLLSKAGKPYVVRDAIAYCYPHGLKLRFQRPGKPKCHTWAFGCAGTCWRGQLRNFLLSPECVVTEGEPDAIRALDSGLDEWRKCAVVALPSASTIPAASLRAFTGKRVFLAMDCDEAGERARMTLIGRLSGIAAEILNIDWTR